MRKPAAGNCGGLFASTAPRLAETFQNLVDDVIFNRQRADRYSQDGIAPSTNDAQAFINGAERLHANSDMLDFRIADHLPADYRFALGAFSGYEHHCFSCMTTVSESEANGFTHIEARCGHCGKATSLGYRLMKEQGRAADDTQLEHIASRLRCSECGTPPISWRQWRQYLDSGGKGYFTARMSQ